MDNMKKGFSLAELLISLLIISIVLSAAIPTITKRSGANREYIWRWSNTNNDIYSAVGWNQSAVLGYDKNPINDFIDKVGEEDVTKLENIMNDVPGVAESDFDNRYNLGLIGGVNFAAIPYSKDGDKFIIMKRPILATNGVAGESAKLSNFANSHISFFTTLSETPTTEGIRYAGRIAMDPDNIAIGKGALQNQTMEENASNNTAIGHFSLFRNRSGVGNTAVGKKTLSYNESGKYNTAMGYGSLFTLGVKDLEDAELQSLPAYVGFENTAIGAMSQQYNTLGSQNTSVGSQSLKSLIYTKDKKGSDYGNKNTAIGWAATGTLLNGDENTAIGAEACSGIEEGSHNICIGANAFYKEQSGEENVLPFYAKKDNYGIYIGSGRRWVSDADKGNAPLIMGHGAKTTVTLTNGTTTKTKNFHQELVVNAKQVVFRPFDGGLSNWSGDVSRDVFKFEQLVGMDGYGEQGINEKGKSKVSGIVHMNLNPDNQGYGTGLRISGWGNKELSLVNNRVVFIDTHDFDPDKSKLDNSLADINFNNMLNFSFPFQEGTNVKAYIDSTSAGKTYKDGQATPSPITRVPLVLQHMIEFQNNTPNFWGVKHKEKDEVEEPASYPDLDIPLQVSFGNIKTNGIVNYHDHGIFIKPKSGKTNIMLRSKTDGSLEEYSFVQSASTSNSILFEQPKVGTSELVPKIHLGPTESGVQGNLWLQAPTSIAMQTDGNLYIYANTGYIKLGGTREDSNGTAISQSGITINGNPVQLVYGPSDARLKNITGDNTAGLKEINELQVKNFTYKDDKEKKPHVGVIAQQLQKIFPTAVSKDDKGYLRIRTEEIFYAMVNAIKELTVKIQDLTAKITGLDKRITELEKQNKQLIEQNKAIQEQNKAIEKRLAKLEKQSTK